MRHLEVYASMNVVELTPKIMSDWIRKASFVFNGHIIAIGKNNLEIIEPDERMVLVYVDDVVMSPTILGDLSGKTITVNLQTLEGIKEGQEMTFFATSSNYGKNIGVTEIGRTERKITEIREVILNERIRQLDEELEKHIKDAKLIISGKILSTYRVGKNEYLPGIEDGVEWWNADVAVYTVEKGLVSSSGIQIFYPRNGERKWSLYPQFQSGQEGIWFLTPIIEDKYKENIQKIKSSGYKEKLVAKSKLDYHAISALQRIQLLVFHSGKGRSC